MAKARKVLNAKRVSEALKQLYVKNAKESGLLKLPPEIRNRTWSYILGGQMIHIETLSAKKGAVPKRRRIQHALCTVQTSDADSAKDSRSRPAISRHDQDHGRHRGCLREMYLFGRGIGRAGVTYPFQNIVHGSLSLLESCRQIHEEASLLPFSDNEFALDKLEDLDHFAKTILCEQASAIRSVSIHVSTNSKRRPLPEVKRMDIIGTRIWRLDELTLFIQMTYRDQVLPAEQHLRRKIVEAHIREYLKPNAKPVSSVAVSITCYEHPSWPRSNLPTNALQSAEIRLLENKMEDGFARSKV